MAEYQRQIGSANNARPQRFGIHAEYAVACESLGSNNAVYACPGDLTDGPPASGVRTRCAFEVLVCAVPDSVLTFVTEHWNGWLNNPKPVPQTIRLLRFTAFGHPHLPDFTSVDAAWSLRVHGQPQPVADIAMPDTEVFPGNPMFFALPSVLFRVSDDRDFFVMFHWGKRNGSGWRCRVREDGRIDAQNKWMA